MKQKDVEAPAVAPPVMPSNASFNFNACTDRFPATNGYYLNNRFFRFAAGLGIPASYWGSIAFPLPNDNCRSR